MMLCRACGGERAQTLFRSGNIHGRHTWGPEAFDIIMCDACGCAYTDTPVDAAYYVAYYRDDYYNTAPSGGFAAWCLGILGRMIFAERRRLIARYVKNERRLKVLEAGCGRGDFLAALPQERFDKYALEINAQALAHIRLHHPDIIVDPGNVRFDLILGWHVLEHVSNPVDFLADLRRRIQKNGVLILAVPNAGGIGFRWTKRYWFHLDTPRHLVHYRVADIRRLLEAAGWLIEGIHGTVFEYPQDLAVSFWMMARSRAGFIGDLAALLSAPILLFLRAFLSVAAPRKAEVVVVAARPVERQTV
jgi:SAM-dependent methyltransferase